MVNAIIPHVRFDICGGPDLGSNRSRFCQLRSRGSRRCADRPRMGVGPESRGSPIAEVANEIGEPRNGICQAHGPISQVPRSIQRSHNVGQAIANSMLLSKPNRRQTVLDTTLARVLEPHAMGNTSGDV